MRRTRDDDSQKVARARSAPSLVGRMQRQSRIAIAFGVILLLLAVLVVANERYFAPEVRRTIDVTRMVRDSHVAMLDQETGLRGYLLTGDSRFLGEYQRGRIALAAIHASDDSLINGDRNAELLLDFRVRQSAWVDGWTEEAIAMGAADTSTLAEHERLLISGQALFTAYRRSYDAVITELFEQRGEALNQQATGVQAVAGGAALITLVSGAVTVRRNRAFRHAVEPPLEALLAHLAAIRTGDLSRYPDIVGPEELHRLGTGLQETAAALALAKDEASAHAEQILTHNRQLGQVLYLAREVAGSLNMRYVLRGVCDATSAITDNRRVVVWLRNDDTSTVEAWADSSGPGMEPIGLEPIAVGEGAVGRSAQYGRVEGHVGDLIDNTGGRDDELAVPMVVGAEVIGVLLICGAGASTIPRGTLDVLEALAVQAASAIGSARLLERTEMMAMTDALTHLPNRRQLEADLATEVGVSTRYDRPLAFAMLDVDHFKDYNDTLGHQAGDVALQELAGLLSGGARAGDTVYRYGGEEIAIILRETTADAASGLAERLRAKVEHHFAGPSQPRAVTISAGVAAIPQHASTGAELVAAADAALYAAKRAGRNQVLIAAVGEPLGGQVSRQ